jgi:pyruvate kinase
MAQIARTIEGDRSWQLAMRAMTAAVVNDESEGEPQAIARAAATIAMDLHARAIAVLTATGGTARRVSQQRPGVPILAFADRPDVAASLSLWHGVKPIHEELATSTDQLIAQVVDGTRRRGYAEGGDLIVIVGSVPRAEDRSAVFLELHRLP